jgi:hypothetical protein
MKTAVVLLAAMAMVSLSGRTSAATVNPSGYSNTFGVQPSADDWATLSVAGGANDQYEVDADVNANITAGGVTAQTTASAGEPPAAAGTATWHSANFYLQTRPTGNRYTALMAKFVNNTGTNATEISISYLFTIAAGGIVEEATRGNRVYYSLNGSAGSWVNVAALNNTSSTAGSQNVTANVALSWPDGGSLYLLWTDDNATGQGTDSANQIDDFALQTTSRYT